MAKSKSVESEKQELSIGKIISIVVLVFTFVPVSVLSIVYLTNENFQYIANRHLSNGPGFIGKYFQSFPTREEREAQKRKVANYLLDLDLPRAADKLILIKKEDEALYSALVKIMTEKNAKQTGDILELIRDSSMKKDILVSTLEQIDNEKKVSLSDKAKYYETLSLPNLIGEIKDALNSGIISFHDMGQIVEQMNEKTAVKILSGLDEEISSKLTSYFESGVKRQKLEEIVNQMKDKEKSLIHMAQIYNTEKPDKLIEDLGSEKKFKMEELSVIYRNMSILQGAKVLSKIEDKDFIIRLFNRMKEDEIIREGKDFITPDLSKAMKIYSEYDRKVQELVGIYKKMEPQQVADMVTKLFKNSKASKQYTLENGENLVIGDRDIAIDVMKNLPQKLAAEVLASLDADLASEISKTLALPNG